MKILKPGIKGQYFRFKCHNCHCEYVADVSEINFNNDNDGSLIGSIATIVCPDCNREEHIVVNEYFYEQHECDEDGNLLKRPLGKMEVAINS